MDDPNMGDNDQDDDVATATGKSYGSRGARPRGTVRRPARLHGRGLVQRYTIRTVNVCYINDTRAKSCTSSFSTHDNTCGLHAPILLATMLTASQPPACVHARTDENYTVL